MSLQAKLEREINTYNDLIDAIQKLDEERTVRLGRIQMLQELVAQSASEEKTSEDVMDDELEPATTTR